MADREFPAAGIDSGTQLNRLLESRFDGSVSGHVYTGSQRHGPAQFVGVYPGVLKANKRTVLVAPSLREPKRVGRGDRATSKVEWQQHINKKASKSRSERGHCQRCVSQRKCLHTDLLAEATLGWQKSVCFNIISFADSPMVIEPHNHTKANWAEASPLFESGQKYPEHQWGDVL